MYAAQVLVLCSLSYIIGLAVGYVIRYYIDTESNKAQKGE